MSSVKMSERVKKDSIGVMAIPGAAYYGVQTARGMANFPISGTKISQYPVFIKALAHVKLAASRANVLLDQISADKASAIAQVCEELLAGLHHDEFSLDVLQGGAGTSTNMNANEVIANRGLELMGLPRGHYHALHPNNDVNLSQSTNDVYPTAIRVAILLSFQRLVTALGCLIEAFEFKATEFSEVIKLGRTQLQDAVPMTLGQEMKAFASTLNEDLLRLRDIVAIFHEVNLGGTAIGTGINTPADYQRVVVEQLRQTTNLPLVPAVDLIEASWDTGAFVLFSGMLKRTATKLSKICNDLRLLSSGPRGGLNEINLPAMQPGSSIMPGKVNPVIPEVVNQVAFQIIGLDLTVTLASEAGQLQLNAMEPVILHSLLQSMQLLTNATEVLTEKCVIGITANADVCRRHLEASTAIAAALTPLLGYERATDLAKSVLATGKTMPQAIAECSDLPIEILRGLSHSALASPNKHNGE